MLRLTARGGPGRGRPAEWLVPACVLAVKSGDHQGTFQPKNIPSGPHFIVIKEATCSINRYFFLLFSKLGKVACDLPEFEILHVWARPLAPAWVCPHVHILSRWFEVT